MVDIRLRYIHSNSLPILISHPLIEKKIYKNINVHMSCSQSKVIKNQQIVIFKTLLVRNFFKLEKKFFYLFRVYVVQQKLIEGFELKLRISLIFRLKVSSK